MFRHPSIILTQIGIYFCYDFVVFSGFLKHLLKIFLCSFEFKQFDWLNRPFCANFLCRSSWYFHGVNATTWCKNYISFQPNFYRNFKEWILNKVFFTIFSEHHLWHYECWFQFARICSGIINRDHIKWDHDHYYNWRDRHSHGNSWWWWTWLVSVNVLVFFKCPCFSHGCSGYFTVSCGKFLFFVCGVLFDCLIMHHGIWICSYLIHLFLKFCDNWNYFKQLKTPI